MACTYTTPVDEIWIDLTDHVCHISHFQYDMFTFSFHNGHILSYYSVSALLAHLRKL